MFFPLHYRTIIEHVIIVPYQSLSRSPSQTSVGVRRLTNNNNNNNCQPQQQQQLSSPPPTTTIHDTQRRLSPTATAPFSHHRPHTTTWRTTTMWQRDVTLS
jgi:hypothetical protein